MSAPTTQAELDSINAAVAASGSPRQKKLAKAALAAFEGGLFTTDTAAAWVNTQRIKTPELFVAKASTNPWSPNFPAAGKHEAIASFIQKFGTAASSRMAAGQDVDIAGRPLVERKRA